MDKFKNDENVQKSNHFKRQQSNRRRENKFPPEKKMTKYIYRSYQENNPPEDWVREELIQSN